MANWVTKLAEQRYRIGIRGKVHQLTQDQLCNEIKSRLKATNVVRALLQKFKLDPRLVDKLQIQICELKGRYAETDGKVMKLNREMFDNENFFEENFFIILHELFHFFSRSKERQQGADGYFSDPEERDAFVISLAYEMEKGSNIDELYNKVYPKIAMHFSNEVEAKEFFENLLLKAQTFL